MTTLLDASAWLALINEERGAAQVRDVIEDAAVSAVNAAEVASKLIDFGWSAAQVEAHLVAIKVQQLDFDRDTARLTGQLRRSTLKQGLSLADQACLATAQQHSLPVLTSDRVWKKLRIRGVRVQCIR